MFNPSKYFIRTKDSLLYQSNPIILSSYIRIVKMITITFPVSSANPVKLFNSKKDQAEVIVNVCFVIICTLSNVSKLHYPWP